MDGMQAVYIALITGFMSPIILAILMNRARRADKREDWARQDAVEARTKAAADAVMAQAAEAARLLVQNNTVVSETSKLTNAKLDVIHTLVNSNMDRALEAELDARKQALLLMQEVMALNKRGGIEPSSFTLQEIATAKAKIDELTATLADRREQQKKIEEQQAVTAQLTGEPAPKPGVPGADTKYVTTTTTTKVSP